MWVPGLDYVKRAASRVKKNLTNPKAYINFPLTGGFSFLLGDDDLSDTLQNALIGAQIAGLTIGAGSLLAGGTAAGGTAAGGTAAGGTAAGGAAAGLTTSQKILLGALAGKFGYDMLNNQRNYELSKEYSESNLELQQQEFEYQKWLNEHGIGQQLAQYQAAGINPMAATAGSQSSAQSTPVSAPERQNDFDSIFNAGINLYSLKSELQARKDIAESQNATNESIAHLNAATSSDINLANISAREREYKYEQEQITARDVAHRIIESDKINFDQKKQLLDSISKIESDNQMNKIEYQKKRSELVQSLIDEYQSLLFGSGDVKGFKVADVYNAIKHSGLAVREQYERFYTKCANFLEGLRHKVASIKDKEDKKRVFASGLKLFIDQNTVDPYNDVSTSRYESMLEALND